MAARLQSVMKTNCEKAIEALDDTRGYVGKREEDAGKDDAEDTERNTGDDVGNDTPSKASTQVTTQVTGSSTARQQSLFFCMPVCRPMCVCVCARAHVYYGHDLLYRTSCESRKPTITTCKYHCWDRRVLYYKRAREALIMLTRTHDDNSTCVPTCTRARVVRTHTHAHLKVWT